MFIVVPIEAGESFSSTAASPGLGTLYLHVAFDLFDPLSAAPQAKTSPCFWHGCRFRNNWANPPSETTCHQPPTMILVQLVWPRGPSSSISRCWAWVSATFGAHLAPRATFAM